MKVREQLRGMRWQGAEVGSLLRQEMGWKTSGIQFSGGLITAKAGAEGEIKQYCLSAFCFRVCLHIRENEQFLKCNRAAGKNTSCKHTIYY